MLLPEQIISSLEEDIQKYFKQEKSVTSYSSDKISLKADGTVYSFGANTYGQLGTGNTKI